MKKFILNIFNNLFSLNEKFKKPSNPNILTYQNSMSKNAYASGVSLSINVELAKNKEKIKNEVKKIAKENIDNFENLFMHAKKQGAEFFILFKASKFLKPINEETGVIFETKGFRALYLNLILKRKISFTIDTLFVFEDEKINPYKVLYNFYKWYAYKSGMPGFKNDIQAKIKKLEKNQNQNLDNLTFDEIMNLKSAIDLEKNAMEFTIEFMKELEGAKNAYSSLKDNEGGANI